jgi:four helix bundle protein
VRNFRQLVVWEKAHRLALMTYQLIRRLPGEERYGLTDQMRRAAVSIPSNIAEGCGRDTDRDFAKFLKIAAGSTSELEYQVLLARDLGYVSAQEHAAFDEQLNEVKRMLNGLTRKLTANC